MCEETRPTSKSIKTLYKYDTEYSADSVEWCPHEGSRNLFVCANYQLKENEAKDDKPCERVGRILLFSISPNGLKLLQTINTAAVLDQKWCHVKVNNKSLLGVVNAKKTIEIYELDPNSLMLSLITSLVIEDDENETLILSLDWSTGKYESTQPEIVCSDSKGNIHRLQFDGDKLILEHSWHAHDFEAWIAGFYYWDTNIIFTGGDDSVLCKFDKRCGDQSVSKNRSHEAGVTSLHSNSSKEHVLVTGSYDEYVRIWDIRKMKSPINSIKMPGTLWRLKWDPFKCNHILAACMLGGVHVIKDIDTTKLEIIESYYEHKNISYGADWCTLNREEVSLYEGEGNVIIGTCSFYDHLLCISKFSCDF